MKHLPLLLALLLFATTGFAQQKGNCRDVVVLRDGSVFRGTVTVYQHDGDLEMTTWSGSSIRVPSSNVRRVRQVCTDEAKQLSVAHKSGFREKGWYHAPRLQTFWASNGTGVGLQYSTGMQFNRLFGAGFGLGIENLTPWGNDVASFPIFAEARGYLWDKYITPYYTLGFGWALMGQGEDGFEGSVDDWRGGFLGQGQIGLRIGDNLTVHTGLRFQRKTRTWSRWWGVIGEDKILQKRFEFGIGLVF
jgi:hypothetical protein